MFKLYQMDPNGIAFRSQQHRSCLYQGRLQLGRRRDCQAPPPGRPSRWACHGWEARRAWHFWMSNYTWFFAKTVLEKKYADRIVETILGAHRANTLCSNNMFNQFKPKFYIVLAVCLELLVQLWCETRSCPVCRAPRCAALLPLGPGRRAQLHREPNKSSPKHLCLYAGTFTLKRSGIPKQEKQPHQIFSTKRGWKHVKPPYLNQSRAILFHFFFGLILLPNLEFLHSQKAMRLLCKPRGWSSSPPCQGKPGKNAIFQGWDLSERYISPV